MLSYSIACFLDGRGYRIELKKQYWYVIVIYIVMQLGGAGLAYVLRSAFQLDPFKVAVYVNIGSFLIAAVLFWMILRKDLQDERMSHPLSVGKIIGYTALGMLMVWAAEIAAGILEMSLIGSDPTSENTQAIVEISKANPLFILVPALVGPILEELVFRKILFGTFYKRMNFFFAAILSSLLYSVAHMEFTHIFIYMFMGIVLAFLYVWTKRIIVPILVHMAINTIAVLGQTFIDIDKLEEKLEKASLILFGG